MNFEYDNPKAYDEKYAGNSQAKMEDDMVVRIVDNFIDMGNNVLDLGCGTGLVFQLLRHKLQGFYLGVDLSREMILECRARYAQEPRAGFAHMDCYAYMTMLAATGHRRYDLSCISLYALDLMNPDIVRLISMVCTGGCFFVVFNEPWKPWSASVWAGAKEEYDKQARANSEEVRRQLRYYGFTLTPFCNQDYYYLATRQK